jgi:sulfite exporter TauE/SafE
MCGALTLALPVRRGNTSSFLAGKIVYNLGRTFTYSLLGLLLGASKLMFGAMLFDIHTVQELLSISIGVGMLMSVVIPKTLRTGISTTPLMMRLLGKLRSELGRFLTAQSLNGQFCFGMVNGLLPCGFVYMALALAALSATLQEATFSMMLFGLGTIPAMLGVAVVMRFSGKRVQISSSIRRYMPVVVVLLGVLFIVRGLSLGIPYLSPALTAQPAGLEAGCHVQGK